MSHYLSAFEAFSKERSGDAVHGLRRRAMARFSELGFPTVSQEDWRFTNTAPIAASTFALGRPTTNASAPQRIA